MVVLKNKKGAEMAIGTIIIIVLALVVLVFLIFALTKGTGSLSDYLSNLFGTSNLDTIKNACATACSSNLATAFCEDTRTLKINKAAYLGSCATLGHGIDACLSITCTAFPKKCSELVLAGLLSDVACDTQSTNLFSSVGDSEGKDVNKLRYCCQSKLTGMAVPPLPSSP